jgi:hypothetical protein
LRHPKLDRHRDAFTKFLHVDAPDQAVVDSSNWCPYLDGMKKPSNPLGADRRVLTHEVALIEVG